MNRILVTGANGQLGSEIREQAVFHPDDLFFYVTRNELDITDHNEVRLFVESKKINVIINCAAYTGVDKAESDFIKADEINNVAVRNLAVLARENNIKLIHISTDYVFDGNNCKPYIETDKVNPQSVYGKTKLAGELAIENINPENSIIIRTSWVYSSYGNNFVKTMLKLSQEKKELNVIFDQVGTPTYARDLAEVILNIIAKINNKKVEIFHYSNEGICSWYDFSKAIFEKLEYGIKVNPIQTIEYPTPAKRPYYSILNKNKIKEKYQIVIPYWKDSLKKYFILLNKE